MDGERTSDIDIPFDLVVEILKKLRAKPLMRFRCVSKQWKNIISNSIVIDSIVPRSLTQPLRYPNFIFHNILSYEPFSSVSSYTYQNEEQEIFGEGKCKVRSLQYVRGLIGFWSRYKCQFTMHNPTTRQSFSLPNRPPSQKAFYLFGYDPLKNQYKVVYITPSGRGQSCQVFTLGNPKKKWRNIQLGMVCHNLIRIGHHHPFQHVVCINGVIYYEAFTWNDGMYILVSFDVRSEKFNLVQVPKTLRIRCRDSTLVNYQGKLGFLCCNHQDVDLWVMENAEKQEWSMVTLYSMLQDLPSDIWFSSVTHPSGEIVIVHRTYDDAEFPLAVYCYDTKRKSRRRVEMKNTTSKQTNIGGFIQFGIVTDHVENTMRL